MSEGKQSSGGHRRKVQRVSEFKDPLKNLPLYLNPITFLFRVLLVGRDLSLSPLGFLRESGGQSGGRSAEDRTACVRWSGERRRKRKEGEGDVALGGREEKEKKRAARQGAEGEKREERRGKKGYAEIILALLAPAVTVVSVSSCTLRRTRGPIYGPAACAPTLRHRLIYIPRLWSFSFVYTGEKFLPRPDLCAIVNLSSRAPKCVCRPREEKEAYDR